MHHFFCLLLKMKKRKEKKNVVLYEVRDSEPPWLAANKRIHVIGLQFWSRYIFLSLHGYHVIVFCIFGLVEGLYSSFLSFFFLFFSFFFFLVINIGHILSFTNCYPRYLKPNFYIKIKRCNRLSTWSVHFITSWYYFFIIKPKHQSIFCVNGIWTPNILFNDKKLY